MFEIEREELLNYCADSIKDEQDWIDAEPRRRQLWEDRHTEERQEAEYKEHERTLEALRIVQKVLHGAEDVENLDARTTYEFWMEDAARYMSILHFTVNILKTHATGALDRFKLASVMKEYLKMTDPNALIPTEHGNEDNNEENETQRIRRRIRNSWDLNTERDEFQMGLDLAREALDTVEAEFKRLIALMEKE